MNDFMDDLIQAAEECAEKGDWVLAYKVAQMYEQGEEVCRNMGEAVKWYQKCADLGDPFSKHKLAAMYYNGEHVRKNCAKASELFVGCMDILYSWGEEIAGITSHCPYDGIPEGLTRADFTDPEVRRSFWKELLTTLEDGFMSWMYLEYMDEGERYCVSLALMGISKDSEGFEKAATHMLLDAAQAGYPDAQYVAATLMLSRTAMPGKAPFVGLFESAASCGHPQAMLRLGKIYLTGMGTRKSKKKAFEWMKKAADHVPEAVYYLSKMYENGVGTDVDKAKAEELRRKADELSDAETKYAVAVAYEQWDCMPRDPDTAMELYRVSAEQGCGDAICWLAALADGVRGDERNVGTVAKLYRKAADLGHFEGLYYMGRMLEAGDGMGKDLEAAYAAFMSAGDAMHMPSMMAVADMYRTGTYLEKDVETAARIYGALVVDGYMEAVPVYAQMLIDGEGVEKDAEYGKELLEEYVPSKEDPRLTGHLGEYSRFRV